MDKAKELEKIAKQIAKCKVCQKDKVGLPVPGEGNPDADIVFIGEAPGKKEAATGKPFIGRAGKLLRGLLSEVGINPNEVYITSPVKYLPKHITPTLEEIAHGRVHLNSQLKIIQPRIVVLMGRVAALAVLSQSYSVAQDHGKIIKLNGLSYFLTYHPAAPLYSPKLREVISKDFKKIKRLVAKI